MTADYDRFLGEMGLTADDMEQARRRMPPPVPRDPSEPYSIRVSPIHGLGAFATKAIPAGAFIARMTTDDGWTEAGRYMNHSDDATCEAFADPDLRVRARLPVDAGTEMTVDYRKVRDLLIHMGSA